MTKPIFNTLLIVLLAGLFSFQARAEKEAFYPVGAASIDITPDSPVRLSGYEGGLAMIYFDRPTRFAENVEDLIIAAVHDLLPKEMLIEEKD